MLINFNFITRLMRCNFISEANPNEKIQSIAIHSNESSIVTNCTLSDLRSPDLTQIISDKRSEVIGSHFETSSDVFECVQPSNESSTFFTKPPLVVFGMNNTPCTVT